MIFNSDPGDPMVIIIGPDGKETGNILRYSCEAIRLTFELDGYALEIDGDGVPMCDFRRSDGRVWTSRHGQEIRIFGHEFAAWQIAIDGMDVTHGQYHRTEQEALQAAQEIDAYSHAPYADYPKWADMLAEAAADEAANGCAR